MKSSILLTIYTLVLCTTTAQRAFCPVRSPSGQLIYFTDRPSWSATSMLKTQCTMECSFCLSKQTCGSCRAFNYNSTSQNCSIFNFEPTSYGIDPKGLTAGYRENVLPVPGFWATITASLCAAIFNGITAVTRCLRVYKADQFCGIDRYYCTLPNGTEAFCIPDNSTGLPANCSFPFTFNGTIYFGCAPGVGCLTVNRTANLSCSTRISLGVINDTVIPSGQSVPVQSIFGWIFWMRKTGDAFNWNLTWTSYKNGFGSFSDSNFWLGLENVRQLTSSSNYRLRIELKVSSSAVWRSVEYWSFTVGDEMSTQYQLNVDGFSGDTDNGLQYVNQTGTTIVGFPNGMKFSTFDVDNDLWSGDSCGKQRSCGWWYRNCSRSCPTCSGTYFRWIDSTIIGSNNFYFLSEARMMMKPR